MSTRVAAQLPEGVDAALAPKSVQVIASVRSWWSVRASNAGLNGRWLDVTAALEAQPPSPLPEIDVPGPRELGQAYVESLDAGTRSKNGQHYTPAVLAERLWDMAREALGYAHGVDTPLTGLVRDPACGAGALLLPPLREHLRASMDVDPSILLRGLPSRIQGIDQDPWSAWLTNVILGAELLRVLSKVPEARRSPIPTLAITGDGLARDRSAAMVSLQNPPYGRVALSEQTRSLYSHVLYGHANLYSLFLAAGAADVGKHGVVAALVPTSFTAGRYFHRLRGYLAAHLPLRAITFVDGRNDVFAGVLQETCMVTFGATRKGRVRVQRSNERIESVALVPAPIGDLPWILPRESMDAALAAAATKMPLTLESAGWHASTGPLVWNRRRNDLYPRQAKGRAVVLWGADLSDGKIQLSKSRASLRYFALTHRTDESVMLLTEPAVLVQRTTAPEQTRRLVSTCLDNETLAILGGRVVVENHVNVLRSTVEAPLISAPTLDRVLRTRTMDRVIRCISGSVGISSYELGSLPLPAAGVLASWETLTDAELERAVSQAFGAGGSTS